jgi:hypothetical protein
VATFIYKHFINSFVVHLIKTYNCVNHYFLQIVFVSSHPGFDGGTMYKEQQIFTSNLSAICQLFFCQLYLLQGDLKRPFNKIIIAQQLYILDKLAYLICQPSVSYLSASLCQLFTTGRFKERPSNKIRIAIDMFWKSLLILSVPSVQV